MFPHTTTRNFWPAPGLRRRPQLALLACAWQLVACGRQTEQPTLRETPGDAGPSAPIGEPRLWCGDQPCFPREPISDGLLPVADAKRLFDWALNPEHGPCIYEPQRGALFPNNSLRPRVRFEPLPGEDLWEIRWSAESEENDLVVYTSSLSGASGQVVWPMPEEIWDGLATSAPGATIEVRVRGRSMSDPSLRSESHTEFRIAPVAAAGAIVYWSTDGAFEAGGETSLRGFSLGEETTQVVLKPSDVEATSLDGLANPKSADADAGLDEGEVRCIGCHTSTPDGKGVAFVDSWPWNSILAGIDKDEPGKRPSYLSGDAAKIIQQPWQGSPTFSETYWAPYERRLMVQSIGSLEESGTWPRPPDNADGWNATGQDQLIWFDLDYQPDADDDTLSEGGPDLIAEVDALLNVAYGFIVREGDPSGAVNPDWSHDGQRIAYVSTAQTLDGHAGGRIGSNDAFDTDIRIVPFDEDDSDEQRGGESVELEGAASPNYREYYPDFSADDSLIAFTRAEGMSGPVYYRSDGEIYVVPSTGGEAVRLAANDAPSCSDQPSPGLHNSWPKWAPEVQEDQDGKRYYWLIFSSARRYVGQFDLVPDEYSPGGPSSQLYMAGVVVDGDEITTFPAVYLWNQSRNTSNLTPAWDKFDIPPIAPPK